MSGSLDDADDETKVQLFQAQVESEIGKIKHNLVQYLCTTWADIPHDILAGGSRASFGADISQRSLRCCLLATIPTSASSVRDGATCFIASTTGNGVSQYAAAF